MTAYTSPAAMVEEEAARWLLLREEPGWSADDDSSLAAWLDQSMVHRAAFWRLEHGWAAADRVAALGPETPPSYISRQLWQRAVARIAQGGWAMRSGIAASFLAAGLVGGAWWQACQPIGSAAVLAYRTSVGGHRLLKLADGSRVEMNTATTLRSTARPDAREVWLDEGEAYFDIVHRADRSFVVHAGPRTIIVLGTRFIVHRVGQKVTVAVLSGRVRVEDASGAAEGGTRARSAVVTTGDVAVAEPRATLISTDNPGQVAAIAAWREGMIVFDDTPLSEAVAELNRYRTQPIRIADPALADLRIGGSFRTGDGAVFVELMRRAYHVRVRTRDDSLVLER